MQHTANMQKSIEKNIGRDKIRMVKKGFRAVKFGEQNKTKIYRTTEKISPKDEEGVIEGYAIVFEQVANVGGAYYEVIDKDALAGTKMIDIPLLINHDENALPIARFRENNAESTMQLKIDEYGVFITAKLDIENNAKAREVYSAIKRGDVTEMSFAFSIEAEKEEWMDPVFAEGEEIPKYPMRTRRILKIAQIYDISIATNGVYAQTYVVNRNNTVPHVWDVANLWVNLDLNELGIEDLVLHEAMLEDQLKHCKIASDKEKIAARLEEVQKVMAEIEERDRQAGEKLKKIIEKMRDIWREEATEALSWQTGKEEIALIERAKSRSKKVRQAAMEEIRAKVAEYPKLLTSKIIWEDKSMFFKGDTRSRVADIMHFRTMDRDIKIENAKMAFAKLIKRSVGQPATFTSEERNEVEGDNQLITTTTGGTISTGIFIPKIILHDILGSESAESGFLKEIHATELRGVVEFPYAVEREIPDTDAIAKGEGEAADNITLSWENLQLAQGNYPLTINVSMEVLSMTEIDFADYILDLLKKELERVIVQAVLYGKGENNAISGVCTTADKLTYADGEEIDCIQKALLQLSKRARTGAKVFLSYALFNKINFKKDINGQYLFPLYGAGINTIATVPIVVEENLKDGDFLVGNPENYLLNYVKPIEIYNDLHGRTRILESTAHVMLAGKAVPSRFVCGKRVQANAKTAASKKD